MKYGVGIDISKGKSTVAILSVEGEIIEEPFEIMHNINGLTLLEEKMNKLPKEDLIKQGKAYWKRSNNIPMVVLGYLTPKEKRAELELAVA